jgi:uncharacterized membrane protein
MSVAKRWSASRAPTAATLAGAGVFLLSWGLVHAGFWAHDQIVDTPTYQRYGDLIVNHGKVPYRDFALEYPPGALPVFAFPSLFDDYAQAFSWLMAACGVALVAVVASVRLSAVACLAVSPLLVGSLIFSRFDLWPALLVAAGLVALVAGADVAGWALLGIAVAAKLWPLALVPVALVWSLRRGRTRAPWAGAATAAAFFVPFAIVAPRGLWASLRGQASRPLQIESLGAAFLKTFGHPRVITTHGSQNLAGEDWVAALLVAAMGVSLLALWVGFARGPASRDRLLRYAAATTCAVVAFGKVLSPQFLIWLVPLVPLVRGRRGAAATALLAAALVLTQVWFPSRYFDYVDGSRFAGVVLARDLVLVALLGVLAAPLRDLDA